MVDSSITSCIEKCHVSSFQHLVKLRYGRAVGVEFLAIAHTELVKTPRLMSEPLSQSWRWRNVLEPATQMLGIAAHAPRPETVDKHTLVIFIRRLVVYPLNPQPARHHSSSRLWPIHAGGSLAGKDSIDASSTLSNALSIASKIRERLVTSAMN